MVIKHPDDETLQQYVAGKLNAVESEIVMDHLSVCDECLEKVDRLWEMQSVGPAVSTTLLINPHLERRLSNQIHRSDLGGKLVKLGLGGFLDVVVALIRPFFGPNSKKKARGEGYD